MDMVAVRREVQGVRGALVSAWINDALNNMEADEIIALTRPELESIQNEAHVRFRRLFPTLTEEFFF